MEGAGTAAGAAHDGAQHQPDPAGEGGGRRAGGDLPHLPGHSPSPILRPQFPCGALAVGNQCFYGKCSYYCDSRHAICGKPDAKLFSVQIWAPEERDVASPASPAIVEKFLPRARFRSPYRRSPQPTAIQRCKRID